MIIHCLTKRALAKRDAAQGTNQQITIGNPICFVRTRLKHFFSLGKEKDLALKKKGFANDCFLTSTANAFNATSDIILL